MPMSAFDFWRKNPVDWIEHLDLGGVGGGERRRRRGSGRTAPA